MSVVKKYVREIARQFNFHATWKPSMPISLGDVLIPKSRFHLVPIDNVRNLGVEFEVAPGVAYEDIDHASEGVRIIRTDVGAGISEGITNSEIGVNINYEFSQSGSFVMQFRNVKVERIDNQIALGRQVLEIFKEGNWDRSYRVVTHLLRAEEGAVFVSSSKAGQMSLHFDGTPPDQLEFITGGAEFQFHSREDLAHFSRISVPHSPMFLAARIRRRFFGADTFRSASIQDTAALDDLPFTRAELAANPEQFSLLNDDVRLLLDDD